MGAHFFKNGDCQGVVHVADIYKFGGYTFEFHKYMGPCLLNKDLEPRKGNIGMRSKFWNVFEEWTRMSEDKKEETRIYG